MDARFSNEGLLREALSIVVVSAVSNERSE